MMRKREMMKIRKRDVREKVREVNGGFLHTGYPNRRWVRPKAYCRGELDGGGHQRR